MEETAWELSNDLEQRNEEAKGIPVTGGTLSDASLRR